MFMLNFIVLEQLTMVYAKMVVKGDELKLDVLISNSKLISRSGGALQSWLSLPRHSVSIKILVVVATYHHYPQWK